MSHGDYDEWIARDEALRARDLDEVMYERHLETRSAVARLRASTKRAAESSSRLDAATARLKKANQEGGAI